MPRWSLFRWRTLYPKKCVAGHQAMKDEQRIFILSPNSVFVLFHACRELSTSLALVNVGAVRAWDEVHHVSEFQCWPRVLHIYKRFPKRLGRFVSNEKIEGTKVSDNQF